MGPAYKIPLVAGSLALISCADPDIQVRSTGGASTAANGDALITQGRAQLALGNPGLALESFRKLQRERPTSADAFAGIAAAYHAMGRHDLERKNYEFALAYAPGDSRLLSALENVLYRLGERPAVTLGSDRSGGAANEGRQSAMGVPQLGSITVPLPAARTAFKRIETTTAAAAAQIDERLAGSPSRRPDGDDQTTGSAAPLAGSARTPYLERLSSGEVALVTTSGPNWAALKRAMPEVRTVLRDQQSVSEVQPGNERLPKSDERLALPARERRDSLPRHAQRPTIRLLNAARIEGLARRTRLAVHRTGLRKVEVGNAVQVRKSSIVFYSASDAEVARRLSFLLGCKAVQRDGIKSVVVLLGRDAASGKTRLINA